MRTLVWLAIVAQLLCSQSGRSPRQSPDILTFVDRARGLPPEFRADTILRLVESPAIAQARKQELIEDAFWSGSHAYLPYIQNTDVRSDFVAMNTVRANRLEALTLQARAVQAMLSVNSVKALRMFEQIAPFDLPTLSCATVFTPNVVDYYQTAVLVFDGSFSVKQRIQGEDLALLERLIAAVESPAQVPPVLEMLFAVNVTPVQRRELLSLLSTALDRISRSDREYGGAETALVVALSQTHLRRSEADLFLAALRAYIVRHVSARRCTDNLAADGKLVKSAEQFNVLIAKLDPEQSHFKVISAGEAKPAGDDGTFQQTLTGQSAESEAIEDALKWLTHGNRSRNGQVARWTLTERSTDDWLQHFDDASKLVHDLKESDEASPEAFFCEKSDALNILAALAPPSAKRDATLEEYRDFLESYYASIQNPNLWFTMFRHMLYTARFSDDPGSKASILDELSKSTNPIISLYAKLETSIGPPRETYPPQHVQAAHK